MANVAKGKKKTAGKGRAASGSKSSAATETKATGTKAPAKAKSAKTAPKAAAKTPAVKAGAKKKAPKPVAKPSKAPAASSKKAPSRSLTAVEPATAAGSGGDLKQRFAALASATGKISGMKRSISKSFFDVGVILNQIRDERLYEVKGYGSFEAFVEREIDLNKVTCLRSARIAEAMNRDVAIEAGLDRASAAVAALDGEETADALSVRVSGGHAMPLVPLHKQ